MADTPSNTPSAQRARARRAAAKAAKEPEQQQQQQEDHLPEPESPTPPVASSSETDNLLRQLLAEQQEHRAEVAALREEINRQKQPMPTLPSVMLSPEQLHEARMAAIAEYDFYCPGCGALYHRERECTGRGEAPHPPIEVISTDELRGNDPSKHTAAPGVSP